MNNSNTIIKGWKGYYTRSSALQTSKTIISFAYLCTHKQKLVMNKDKTVKFRLTSELLAQITHKAKETKQSNTQLITEAINSYLNIVPTNNTNKANLYPQKEVVPTNTKNLTFAQILANKRKQ
jgi:hypothetical protein